MKPSLTGDRNQCPSCSLHFRSSKAFDKHRTGQFGIDRRCLTVPEMEVKGMSTNSQGFWITEQYRTESILSLRQTA